MSELVKRTWVYILDPKEFGIAPCSCGNEDVEWSEYKDHLWCASCAKDFVPKHWGIFDGPILFEMSELLGVHFDRYNLDKNVYEKCIVEDSDIVYYPLLTERGIINRTRELKENSDRFCAMGGFHLDGDKVVLDNKPEKPAGTPSKSD